MKIFKDSITQLASAGYITVQVPECSIGYPIPESTDAPDDWFIRISGYDLSPKGHLHLSRKGFAANKDALRAAFEARTSGRNEGCTWADFEKEIEVFFSKIETNRTKKIASLEKKLQELRNARI